MGSQDIVIIISQAIEQFQFRGALGQPQVDASGTFDCNGNIKTQRKCAPCLGLFDALVLTRISAYVKWAIYHT